MIVEISSRGNGARLHMEVEPKGYVYRERELQILEQIMDSFHGIKARCGGIGSSEGYTSISIPIEVKPDLLQRSR